MNNLQIGNECFVSGCRAEITGQNGSDNWVVIVKENYIANEAREQVAACTANVNGKQLQVFTDSNVAYSVKKTDCEPLISDLYKVGDTIQSTIGGLKGTVTALELSTNRAICMSEKIGNYHDKRTRYAYAYDEIKPYDQNAFEFAIGAKYMLNGKILVKCVWDAGTENNICLIDEAANRVVCALPKTAYLVELREAFGIKSIQRTKY